MLRRQEGFTLIEIVVAFAILAASSVLAVNIITQSSVRANKVNEYLAAINVLESAVAVVRGEIAYANPEKTFHGSQPNGYKWTAEVLKQEHSGPADAKNYISLYQVHVRVVGGNNRQQIELKTIIPDK